MKNVQLPLKGSYSKSRSNKKKRLRAVIATLVAIIVLSFSTVPIYAVETEGGKKTYTIDVEQTFQHMQGTASIRYAEDLFTTKTFNFNAPNSNLQLVNHPLNGKWSWGFRYYLFKDMEEDEGVLWNDVDFRLNFAVEIQGLDLAVTEGFNFLRNLDGSFYATLTQTSPSTITQFPKNVDISIDYGDGVVRRFKHYDTTNGETIFDTDFNHNVSGNLTLYFDMLFENLDYINSSVYLYFLIWDGTNITIENIPTQQLNASLGQLQDMKDYLEMQVPGAVVGGYDRLGSIEQLRPFLLFGEDNTTLDFVFDAIGLVLIIALAGYVLHGKRV